MRLGRFSGNIESAYTDDVNGKYNIVLSVPLSEAYQVRPIVAKCKVMDKKYQFTATFDTYAEKRSADANAYMWVLLDAIAEKLNSSAIDVYKQMVKDYGVFMDCSLEKSKAKSIMTGWSRQGVGWLTEVISESDKVIQARLYFGSSSYSTKQMSRIIDAVVDAAKELGIDTRTPEEIASILAVWRPNL